MMLVIEEVIRESLETREEEIRRARLIGEARRQTRESGGRRSWRWRIEPGMEGAFRDLLGWLLFSQQDARVELAPSMEEVLLASEPDVGAEAVAAVRPDGLVWGLCPSLCCSQAA